MKPKCKICKKIFTKNKRGRPRKYCSRSCYLMANQPLIGPIIVNCFCCSKAFSKYRSGGKRNFCRTCYRKYFTWKTGGEKDGREFTRMIVRIRDKFTCQECKRIWDGKERHFDIHHLGGLCGQFSRTYDNSNYTDGLITLCHKCHLNLPEVKEKMANKSSPRSNSDKKYLAEWQTKNRRYLRLYARRRVAKGC